MIRPAHPALAAFIAQLGDEFLFAQVRVRRSGVGFELRHAEDAASSEEALRVLPVEGLRDLALTTETGAFRPLKSAPSLRRGWRVKAPDAAALEAALNHLYPGGLADWYAARGENPGATHYREFTARQTGMYRITAMLNDAQAASTIRACCDARFCLKRRLWTVAGLEPDAESTPSVVPCLEPCAVFLEFARKAARLEQEDRIGVSIGAGELETLLEALAAGVSAVDASRREADFGDAANPRRMQLLWEKLRGLHVVKEKSEGH